jgi:8-oxo-dGTP pyrophosphatase MutT (NUDIX family)
MHWFGEPTLGAFLREMEEEAGYAVVRRAESDLVLTLGDLPDEPTVVVLGPRLLSED